MVKSVTPAGKQAAGSRIVSKWSQGKWRAGLAGLVLTVPVLTLGGWLAVHQIVGIGPWLADSLRSAVGTERVARLEDSLYSLEDQFNRVWHHGDTPRAHWQVPATVLRGAKVGAGVSSLPVESIAGHPSVGVSQPRLNVASARPGSSSLPAGEPSFQPADVGPMHVRWSAPGDGQWLALSATPTGSGALFKTLLHPDPHRSWAELFIVAIDLRAVRLHLVPGSVEPQATMSTAQTLLRPGTIASVDRDSALAAFNGGFKTEHGQYGMKAQGLILVPPNPGACTISYGKDQVLSVGSWGKLQDGLAGADWWRQTPNCMFEQGVIHPRLAEGYVNQWGATLSGQTVIRRSALGIDATGNTLLVGISNHTTAPALARGMRHAGAVTVAQLDVNHSYPKFVTFHGSRSSALRFAVPLAEGFEYSEQEYLSKPSRRDFFYLTPRRVRTAQTRGLVH